MASDITGCRENSEITDLSKNYGHKKYRQFSADVLNRDELEEMCQVTEHYLGAVSILVNNAGMDTPPKPGKSYAIEDIPQGDSLPVINVNFYGVFLVSQVLGAIMLNKESR
jgi:NADP-dependent 3-hydroxy acid dehydrogenase YdfG